MITVLMSVYNGERYVAETIRSVLAQTMGAFEFLIVDDGSTDATPEILAAFAEHDERVRVVRQANGGICSALNQGVAMARHEWIARIDADDVALPNRFERQLAFIEAHPGLAVTASFVDYINERGEVVGAGVNPFTTRGAVESRIAGGALIYLIHPAVMMRRDVIREVGGYRAEFPLSHDTDLWNRVAERGYQVLVQPETLTQYRLHDSGMTRHGFSRLAGELRWLEACARARRRGKSEPPRALFEAFERRANPLHRFNAWRQDTAFIHYKSATVSRANHDLSPMMLNLGVSALLDPAPTLRNVWSKSVQPALQTIRSVTGAA